MSREITNYKKTINGRGYTIRIRDCTPSVIVISNDDDCRLYAYLNEYDLITTNFFYTSLNIDHKMNDIRFIITEYDDFNYLLCVKRNYTEYKGKYCEELLEFAREHKEEIMIEMLLR